MPKGLVLVIEDDEWVSRLLSAAIQDAGYDAIACATAQSGLTTACTAEPDCILCDIDLPDHDGYWVARSLRAQTSQAALTPFLFLSGFDDQEARLEGFSVGADVYMTKPFRVDEVVAQIDALVQMAERLRRRRDPLGHVAAEASAIEGDLDQMSIATVLTVLEMERRTGVVEVIHQKRSATIHIASGYATEGTLEGASVEPLTALRAMIGWKSGRFSFTPSPDRPAPSSHRSIGAFVLEAVRLEDESVRDDLERLIASTRSPPSSASLSFRSADPASPAGGRASPPSETPIDAAEVEDDAPPISVIPVSLGEPQASNRVPPPRPAPRPAAAVPRPAPAIRPPAPRPTPSPGDARRAPPRPDRKS